MSSERYDIIVIGAGIFGVCSAYYLQKNNPDKRILLIDRLPAAGQGNTAMSAASIRNMFSSETNQLLSDSSIDFYTHIHKKLKFDLSLKLTGYLWLLSEKRFHDTSTKKWMDKISWFAMKEYGERAILHKGKVLLRVAFYLERPKSHYKSNEQLKSSASKEHLKRPDLDKLIRAVQDALTKIIYNDDSQIILLQGTKHFADDRQPGVEINLILQDF